MRLKRWTRLGGRLLTVDNGLFEQWQSAGVMGILLGDGDLSQAKKWRGSDVDKLLSGPMRHITAHGTVQSKNALLLNRTQQAVQQVGMENDMIEWDLPGTEQRGRGFMALLVLVFFVLAGPGAMWWSKRKGQPWRLMVTGPILGVGVCVLVLLIDFVLLGLGRERSVVELTILDRAEKRAYVAHGVASFGGFRLDGIDLPMGSELFVNDIIDSGYYSWRHHRRMRGRGSMHTQLDGAMKTRGTILEARRTGHYATIQEIPERRRVQLFQDSEGNLRLENDLGVAVVEALYIDADNNYWTADAIAAAGQGDLQGSSGGPLLPSLRAAADRRSPPEWKQLMTRLPRRALAQWRPEPGRLYLRLAEPLYPLAQESGEDQSTPDVFLTTIPRLQDADQAQRAHAEEGQP